MPVEPQRSGGTSEGQRLAESNKMPPPGSNRIDAESVGHLSQSGHLVMGPGARRDTAAGNILIALLIVNQMKSNIVRYDLTIFQKFD